MQTYPKLLENYIGPGNGLELTSNSQTINLTYGKGNLLFIIKSASTCGCGITHVTNGWNSYASFYLNDSSQAIISLPFTSNEYTLRINSTTNVTLRLLLIYLLK